MAHSTLELAQAIVVPLMMFIFMLRLNWVMALIMLVPMILGIAIPMALMGRYPDLTDEFAGDTEKLNASANEFITAMPVIKMYHLTAEKFEQYRNSLKIYTDCWVKMCESSCNPLSIALVVLDAEKVNGVWEQRLRIHYNCVGTIEIPSALPLPTPDVSVNTRKGVVVNYAPCDVAI